ncbi:MAG: hypothetical protein KAG66_03090, partial [Methylococcales bacterium]|nr:hypothetical protein [Methylococcales bacterium]
GGGGGGGGGVLLGETSSTAYRGDRGKEAYDHSLLPHAPVGAEANVLPDWAAISGAAVILNKPLITGSNTGDETQASITALGFVVGGGGGGGETQASIEALGFVIGPHTSGTGSTEYLHLADYPQPDLGDKISAAAIDSATTGKTVIITKAEWDGQTYANPIVLINAGASLDFPVNTSATYTGTGRALSIIKSDIVVRNYGVNLGSQPATDGIEIGGGTSAVVDVLLDRYSVNGATRHGMNIRGGNAGTYNNTFREGRITNAGIRAVRIGTTGTATPNSNKFDSLTANGSGVRLDGGYGNLFEDVYVQNITNGTPAVQATAGTNTFNSLVIDGDSDLGLQLDGGVTTFFGIKNNAVVKNTDGLGKYVGTDDAGNVFAEMLNATHATFTPAGEATFEIDYEYINNQRSVTLAPSPGEGSTLPVELVLKSNDGDNALTVHRAGDVTLNHNLTVAGLINNRNLVTDGLQLDNNTIAITQKGSLTDVATNTEALLTRAEDSVVMVYVNSAQRDADVDRPIGTYAWLLSNGNYHKYDGAAWQASTQPNIVNYIGTEAYATVVAALPTGRNYIYYDVDEPIAGGGGGGVSEYQIKWAGRATLNLDQRWVMQDLEGSNDMQWNHNSGTGIAPSYGSINNAEMVEAGAKAVSLSIALYSQHVDVGDIEIYIAVRHPTAPASWNAGVNGGTAYTETVIYNDLFMTPAVGAAMAGAITLRHAKIIDIPDVIVSELSEIVMAIRPTTAMAANRNVFFETIMTMENN